MSMLRLEKSQNQNPKSTFAGQKLRRMYARMIYSGSLVVEVVAVLERYASRPASTAAPTLAD